MAYQGYKNRNHWNVSLWIHNNYPLYRLACDCINDTRTKDIAAQEFFSAIQGSGLVDMKDGKAYAPDGALFTYTTIRAAFRYWNQ